jgi:hypothetical protein
MSICQQASNELGISNTCIRCNSIAGGFEDIYVSTALITNFNALVLLKSKYFTLFLFLLKPDFIGFLM